MTCFILCKSGALPGTEIALSLFVLNSTEPKEPLLGSPRISSYCKSFSVSVQFQQTGGGGRAGRTNRRNAMHYSHACKQLGMWRLRCRRQQCLARKMPEQFRWPVGRDPHSEWRVTQQCLGVLSKALLCLLPFSHLVWPVESNASHWGHLKEAAFLSKVEAVLLECLPFPKTWQETWNPAHQTI